MEKQVSKIKIVIDNREKRPWVFSVPTISGTLSTGDYSVKGLEDYISIEKKDLGDLCNCLGKDRDRFLKEMERARALEFFAIIIEADLKTIMNGRFRSLISVRSLIGSLMTFCFRFNAHVFFAGDRAGGERICEELLVKFVREKQKILEKITDE